MKIVVLCHTARSILNRCEGVALLRKDLQVFIKRKTSIWVDSKLRDYKRGEFGGRCFFRKQKVVIWDNGKFGIRMQKFQVFCTQIYFG